MKRLSVTIKPMNILLLSAYHSASHRYWCDGMMAAFAEHSWTLRSQPARHFSWRIEASGWLWALSDDEAFQQSYDLIIATSLTQVVTLKAQCPALRDVPLWLYFHENQFAHPLSNQQQAAHQTAWQFKSLENAFCADWVSFNTCFNRDTFFAGAEQLLKKFPELIPGDPLAKLKTRSDVLPVPLTDRFSALREQQKDPRLVVWNHRWEWDKAPDRLLEFVKELERRGMPFQLSVLGQHGKTVPEPFRELQEQFGHRLRHFGYLEHKSDYLEVLKSAHFVVSTAIHEFQGLAVLEGVQAGCVPLVPDRQAYPEIFGEHHLYATSEDKHAEAVNACDKLEDLISKKANPPTIQAMGWEALKSEYGKRIKKTASF